MEVLAAGGAVGLSDVRGGIIADVRDPVRTPCDCEKAARGVVRAELVKQR